MLFVSAQDLGFVDVATAWWAFQSARALGLGFETPLLSVAANPMDGHTVDGLANGELSSPPGGSETSGPRVRIEATGRGARVDDGQWMVGWTIQSLDDAPFEISEAWLPHGRFRASRQEFDPPLELAPGEAFPLEFDVSWKEEAETEVENAFVILRGQWRGEEWRVLARLTVRADRFGVPLPRTELVTTQRIEDER